MYKTEKQIFLSPGRKNENIFEGNNNHNRVASREVHVVYSSDQLYCVFPFHLFH